MNIVSEIIKPISHSFRLFGNIMGESMLVLILSSIVKYFVLPVFLWAIFGGSLVLFKLLFSLLTIVCWINVIKQMTQNKQIYYINQTS